MIKFMTYVLDKVLTFKGVVFTGVDNTHPILLQDTVYEDKAYTMVGKKLTTTVGRVDYDYDELAVKFQNNGNTAVANDLVVVNAEYPHGAKENGKIYPHIHVFQTQDTLDRVFTLHYRVQDNDSAKTDAWTEMTGSLLSDGVFSYASGTFNQIIKFKDAGDNDYIDCGI